MESLNIFEASKLGSLKHIQQLVRSGVSINAEDSEGKTPLYNVSTDHNMWDSPVFLYLLKENANINVMWTSKYQTMSPLMTAAVDGHTAAVCCLIQHTADVNLRNNFKDTALTATSGNSEMSHTSWR